MIIEIVVQVTCKHNTQWLVYEPDQLVPTHGCAVITHSTADPSKPP